MPDIKTLLLFFGAAAAELAGCYFVYLTLRMQKNMWLLLPAAICLGLFAWLLSLQTGPAGRTYAAYGGIYIASALLWLWAIEGFRPDCWDVFGAGLALVGMSVIIWGPRGS